MNYLKMADRQRIQALLELGWSHRRIQRETGIDRKTVARYNPRRQAKSPRVSTGPMAKGARVSAGSQSACEPYRHIIEAAVAKGLSAQRIWQDLRDDYHFNHEYASVKRFVRRIKRHRPEVSVLLDHINPPRVAIDYTIPLPLEDGLTSSKEVLRINKTGSGGRTRTYDQAVNSRPLYH